MADAHVENERILLYQRLTQKKDKILEATCEIEDLRRKYINQNQKDDDAFIESEIYKKIFIIIEGLSEIIGYIQPRGIELYKDILNYALHSRSLNGSRFSLAGNKSQSYSHIAVSSVLDAICVSVNSITITWRFKREPIVNLGNLESLIQLLRLPKP